jgi:hypothetical protein
MKLKDNTIYNQPDNHVMVKTDGDLIYVICNKEEQQDKVIKKILTFRILDEYELKPDLN